MTLQQDKSTFDLSDPAIDCFKAKRTVLSANVNSLRMTQSVSSRAKLQSASRAPTSRRINDARADESHHFPHCMLLTGVCYSSRA